jgi:hypothetical protein
MSYYFLVANLPALSLESPPPMDVAAFLVRCAEQLSASDFKTLRGVLQGKITNHPFVAQWRDHDCQIRNAVARYRAQRLGRDATSQLRPHRGYDLSTMRSAEEALSRAHPLERELALDRLRWALLDELAGTNMFSLEHLIAYGLKLQLVHRWAGLSDERGRQRIDEIVAKQMTGADFRTKA